MKRNNVTKPKFPPKPLPCVQAMRDDMVLTFPAIAKLHGISVSKARRLYAKAKYRNCETFVKDARSRYFGLSERSADAAKDAGLRNRKAVLAAVETGELYPQSPRYPDIGWNVCFELYTWALRKK